MNEIWNANSTFKDPLWVYCKYVTSAEIYVVSGPICVFIIIAKFQSTGKCLLFSKKRFDENLDFAHAKSSSRFVNMILCMRL